MTKIYFKTATIKAEQFDGSDEMVDKYHIAIGSGWVAPYRINTLEGWVGVQINSWIATGVNGEHWTITDDVFKKTYSELPVIPHYVAKYINMAKNNQTRLNDLNIAAIVAEYGGVIAELASWIDKNSDTFARAWLDGYQVEEDK
ncbi:DUF1642 domain-containing protein [Lactiplantibacillus plantarum]|nr:DUF1642 domain-containing protein [Lactiplantibacillus plantarum]